MKPTYLFMLCMLLSISSLAQSSTRGRIYLSKDQGGSWLRMDNGFPAEGSVNALALMGTTVFAANV
jgi:hypothetical protein